VTDLIHDQVGIGNAIIEDEGTAAGEIIGLEMGLEGFEVTRASGGAVFGVF